MALRRRPADPPAKSTRCVLTAPMLPFATVPGNRRPGNLQQKVARRPGMRVGPVMPGPMDTPFFERPPTTRAASCESGSVVDSVSGWVWRRRAGTDRLQADRPHARRTGRHCRQRRPDDPPVIRSANCRSFACVLGLAASRRPRSIILRPCGLLRSPLIRWPTDVITCHLSVLRCVRAEVGPCLTGVLPEDAPPICLRGEQERSTAVASAGGRRTPAGLAPPLAWSARLTDCRALSAACRVVRP